MIQMCKLTIMNLPVVLNRLLNGIRCLWGFNLFYPDEIQLCKGQRLDLVASIISSYLQQEGYRVLPVSAAERVDDERICAAFSHKLSANLAGLGWIGKSCLLVTPKNGPRVRWTSILTDAPLNATGVRMEEQCGDCTECVDICPKKAFTGKSFKIYETREVRYDARKCEKYFTGMKNKGQISVCGLCLYICPYGKK